MTVLFKVYKQIVSTANTIKLQLSGQSKLIYISPNPITTSVEEEENVLDIWQINFYYREVEVSDAVVHIDNVYTFWGVHLLMVIEKRFWPGNDWIVIAIIILIISDNRNSGEMLS